MQCMRFVVHEHKSKHHHYDFRLEIDGALKSWAIPKGPSMNPKEKRLAIAVPDQRLEYGDYEGIIPAGSYGAGAVVIWDRGTYFTEGKDHPSAQWKKGHIRLAFSGKKLKAKFAFVRLKNQTNQWLLMKSSDDHADPNWEIKSCLTTERLKKLHVKKPPCHRCLQENEQAPP